MNSKSEDTQVHYVVPPIKAKHPTSRRRMFASGLVIALITFLTTTALLAVFAFMFAPQLSNALWNTDMTQLALYGTSAAVNNAQIIVDITSTAIVGTAHAQQDVAETMTLREAEQNAREAGLVATDEAITLAIVATQTAEVIANELQRTQVAINFNETQSANNQQSTLIAIQATSTQLALEERPQATPTDDNESRPFGIRDEAQLIAHPDDNCNWQGVAGTVVDLQDLPTGNDQFQVRVLSSAEDIVVTIGDNLQLGDSYNWAVRVSSTLNDNIYFLRLETLEGDAISPMARVIFNKSCEENLAVVNFAQILP